MKLFSSLLIMTVFFAFGLNAQSPAPQVHEEEIFKVVEQMPRFPGCEGMFKESHATEECAREKMLEYIYKNLKYPQTAMDQEIEGMCVVQFVVDKEGSIVNAELLRNIGGGCGKAALAMVNNMNNLPEKWISGKQRGRAVSVLYTLPVKFKLPAEDHGQNMEHEVMEEMPPPPPPPSSGMSTGKKKGTNNGMEKEDMAIEEEPMPVFEDMAVEEEPEMVHDEEVFKIVEEMPVFPGCEGLVKNKQKCSKDKMGEYLGKNLMYPEEARKKSISGKVIVYRRWLWRSCS